MYPNQQVNLQLLQALKQGRNFQGKTQIAQGAQSAQATQPQQAQQTQGQQLPGQQTQQAQTQFGKQFGQAGMMQMPGGAGTWPALGQENAQVAQGVPTTGAQNLSAQNVGNGGNIANAGGANNASTGTPESLADPKIRAWVEELVYGPDKETALLELGKRRESHADLAPVLWNSFGVMTALLDEIVAVYPYLSPQNLTSAASNRVCNALALLQCVASHPDTRAAFLHAQIPLFLYPFLNTNSKQRPFEYLRLTALGVIGALVKNETPEVIQFLLTTEIIPLCLKIMESSSDLSKTVAIFIVQKILMDDAGLTYVCQTYDRFQAVSSVLKLMVDQMAVKPSVRLLRHVIKCYLRLADNPDARAALKERLPPALRDHTFDGVLADDETDRKNLGRLVYAVMQ